ncbi:hypothetical protein BCR36DRAFT_361303 [Piromyces finnis]|uniref:Uncharacterized protein n=1 Tax=Piromyces finnis TaxID=1754191 RepID=A0A1Y1UYA5_9FUNG|nr:hypothetical protein BCR36DRAFT_361303 [Piromyces finnis]|eukprot:ORX43265.1 hypothetical protein BCR36DRAFT_361303 [Piromyces finnis]
MSQFQSLSISAHKSKSNYDAKQKKFKSSLENVKHLLNDDESKHDHQKRISKAQTYRLLNCIKVLDYLKDYDIQPCNERICRALKQYGKNKENICKLWEQVLSHVNHKKEAINSILVKNIWTQIYYSNNNNCNTNFYEGMTNNYSMNNQCHYYNNYNNDNSSYNNHTNNYNYCNNNYNNNNIMNNNQPSFQNNCIQSPINSYPTPDKYIFIKDFNGNSNTNTNCYNNNSNNNSNYLPSPEFKPMFMENSHYSSSSESNSSDYHCTYPAFYKPAWTISMEQLQNGNKKTINSSSSSSQQQYLSQYPSPTSSPVYNHNNNNTNNCYNNFHCTY